MVQGNPRSVSIPWTEGTAAEGPGTRPSPAQGQGVLASLPQIRAPARALELTSGVPTSVSKTKQWGNRDQSLSQPLVAGSGGQAKDKSMEIHIPGSWGRTRSPTLDRTSGGTAYSGEGSTTKWREGEDEANLGGDPGRHRAQGPGRFPGLNIDQAYELENAMRMSWSQQSPAVDRCSGS